MNAKPSMFEAFRKVGMDLYKCEGCGRTMRKKDSLILYNRQKRRQYRVCRDCQLKYYMRELKDLNPSMDIKLKMADYTKNIKDGIDKR